MTGEYVRRFCCRCRQWKRARQFAAHRSYASAVSPACRKCAAIRTAASLTASDIKRLLGPQWRDKPAGRPKGTARPAPVAAPKAEPVRCPVVAQELAAYRQRTAERKASHAA
jgi:hypothetical protein